MAPPDEKPAADERPTPEEQAAAEGKTGFVADAVRKAVLAGMGAIFLTEEGARKLARDWKLPKELISYVVSQASGAKTEVMRVVGDEIRRFMESDALRREFIKALTAMSIEVKAEIRLKDAGGGRVKPVVKAAVRPRATRRPAEDGEGDEDAE